MLRAHTLTTTQCHLRLSCSPMSARTALGCTMCQQISPTESLLQRHWLFASRTRRVRYIYRDRLEANYDQTRTCSRRSSRALRKRTRMHRTKTPQRLRQRLQSRKTRTRKTKKQALTVLMAQLRRTTRRKRRLCVRRLRYLVLIPHVEELDFVGTHLIMLVQTSTWRCMY